MTEPVDEQFIYPYIRERVLGRRGHAHVFNTMVPEQTALIVIDLQAHFMGPGMAGELPAARAIVPQVNRLVDKARDRGVAIIWIATDARRTRDIWPLYVTDLLGEKAASAREASLSGAGGSLWPELHVADTDHVVGKTMFSAFAPGSSDLEALLARLGRDTLLIAGTATNTCCDSTARDAAMRNFRTTMVADALAARSTQEHVAALSSFYANFGDVQTVDEALASLDRARPAMARRA